MRKLKEELEDTEIALEAVEAERIAHTRYLTLLQENLSSVETAAELAHAVQKVREEEALFAVQGWVPQDQVEEVTDMADDLGVAALIEEPRPDELPPTLLEQPEERDAAVDLAVFLSGSRGTVTGTQVLSYRYLSRYSLQ